MSALTQKFREVSLTVLPIVVIVLILHFVVTPVDSMELYRFLIGAALIIIGMAIFLLGVDLCITPLGNLFGHALTKSTNCGLSLREVCCWGFWYP